MSVLPAIGTRGNEYLSISLRDLVKFHAYGLTLRSGTKFDSQVFMPRSNMYDSPTARFFSREFDSDVIPSEVVSI